MGDKLKIAYPIIVEGKYDRLRLLSVCEADIYTTDGFGIFKNTEKAGLFRRLAEKTPIIVLTDSDGAGGVIRSRISGMIPKEKLIKLYIPKIEGKEKRKRLPSAEGTLGVEGMERGLLYELLLPYAGERRGEGEIDKADMFLDGLTGRPDSRVRRDEVAKRLGLPTGMNASALLCAMRLLLDRGEYLALVGRAVDE